MILAEMFDILSCWKRRASQDCISCQWEASTNTKRNVMPHSSEASEGSWQRRFQFHSLLLSSIYVDDVPCNRGCGRRLVRRSKDVSGRTPFAGFLFQTDSVNVARDGNTAVQSKETAPLQIN